MQNPNSPLNNEAGYWQQEAIRWQQLAELKQQQIKKTLGVLICVILVFGIILTCQIATGPRVGGVFSPVTKGLSTPVPTLKP